MSKRILWWAVGGGILLTGLYIHRWASLAGRGTFAPIDFSVFYMGALIVREGLGSRLYDFALQAQHQMQLLGGLPMGGNLLPYVSPPHLALVLAPLSLLPLKQAYSIWLVLQMILATALVYRCLKMNPSFPVQERLLLLGGILSFPMLTVTLYKGQLSLIVLFCILFWADSLKRKRDGSIAAWLLIGTIKPQLMVVPVLLTILARRWRALAYALFGGGLILLVCTWILGPSCLWQFQQVTRSIDATFDHRIVYPAYMYNFKGFLTLILGVRQFEIIRIMSGIGFLCALLGVAWLWHGKVNTTDSRFDLKMALSLLLSIFFCSHLYYYDVLLLISVGFFFYAHLFHAGHSLTRWIFLIALYATPPLFLESAWTSIGTWTVRWPAVLMLGWMFAAACLLREPRRSSSLNGSLR